MRGRLITFEGVDGSGKSTQLDLTARWLAGRGIPIVRAYEPGDGPVCDEIRRLLLHHTPGPQPEAELLLFLADRAQHVRTKIAPALEEGRWVLCDRYTDSTRAYQLAGRNLSNSTLDALLSFAELGVKPDCTLWFDLPVNVALERLRSRLGNVTRLDREAYAFHQRVDAAFKAICREEPHRVIRIDAEGSPKDVQKRVRMALNAFFGELA